MQSLMIEEGEYTPAVSFDSTRNVLALSGKSFPENASAFYTPLFEWLQEYLGQLDDDDEVLVTIDLRYYNSSSDRKISDFLGMLNTKAFDDAIAIDVNWCYEEDDDGLRECGEDFETDYRAIVFNLIEIPVED